MHLLAVSGCLVVLAVAASAGQAGASPGNFFAPSLGHLPVAGTMDATALLDQAKSDDANTQGDDSGSSGHPTGATGSSGPTGPAGPTPALTVTAQDQLRAAPPPELGHSVTLAPAGGRVLVEPVGTSVPVALTAATRLTIGSIIDARQGGVVLSSALDTRGRTQAATFGGGEFEVRQARGARGMTDILLRGGSFSECSSAHPRARVATVARARTRRGVSRTLRRVVRGLWASDHHGRFRTFGRSSVATVRGTSWVTLDRCDGTLTQVTHGKVAVRDLARRRTVVLGASHSYLAHAPGA